MPPEEWMFRITDMLDAIAKIQRYTSDISFDDFRADERTVDAVVRNFEGIGEAARRVPAATRDQYAQIPWAAMVAMRNFLIHQYADISLPTVWATIQQDLLPIEPRLRDILGGAEQRKGDD